MTILAYTKAIASTLGAILTALAGLYGNEAWYAIALAIVTGVATYALPNTPASTDPGGTGGTPAVDAA